MRRCVADILMVAAGLVGLSSSAFAAEPASEWIDLFDGVSLVGWKATENPETWSVQNGELVAGGPRSHLFYAGDVCRHNFRNFELEVELHAGKHGGLQVRDGD